MLYLTPISSSWMGQPLNRSIPLYISKTARNGNELVNDLGHSHSTSSNTGRISVVILNHDY